MVEPEVMLEWAKGKYVFRNLYGYAQLRAGFTAFGVAHHMDQVDRRGGKLDCFDLGRLRRFVRTTLGRG